jgi:hydroxymethylglutaryl-CoA reductase (NADPH)
MLFKIPSLILKQLYTYNSLRNTASGIRFSLKNRLTDVKITGLHSLKINGRTVPSADIMLDFQAEKRGPADIDKKHPVDFPLKAVVDFHVRMQPLEPGKHTVELSFEADNYGKLEFSVEDGLSGQQEEKPKVPVDKINNYSDESIKKRQQFVKEFTGAGLTHVGAHSFDPTLTQGNVENFTGVAQIPLGFAGPLTVNGEYAKGDFVIPLATTEGTLVASYNRGMKVLNLSGGVQCTVVADMMQRAPVFVFESSREARNFVDWCHKNIDKIREEAEATSRIAKLVYIDPYLTNKFAYIRFNYSTGDAAGQNMVGRATFYACSWILDHYEKGKIKRFFLESNFATDKKASQVNIMRTRGKRVTAEAVLKRDVLREVVRVEPEALDYHSRLATIGAFFSGANNNGAHSPNAITAMFIATGQDVANVSESSAGIFYSEITETGDLYVSLTIPSLIVATFGGGTGLPTQRECLEVMDCYGKDRAKKFAEIVAGVALAGEISLGAAISSLDWVSSHEKLGRNR